MPKCTKEQHREQKARYYKKHRKGATKAQARYTEEEIEMIKAHSIPDVELAKKLGRSVEAIQVKRAKLPK